MDTEPERHQEDRQGPLLFTSAEVLLLVSISLTWGVAILITINLSPPKDNIEGLLFGAASVAQFFLTFMVAILAIFGWQTLKKIVEEHAVKAIQEETKKLSRHTEDLVEENAGRLNTGMGLVFGRLSRGEDGNLSLRAVREDLLKVAIGFSQESYNKLSKIDSPHRWRALNNLIFYQAMLGMLATADPDFILEKAAELRKAAIQLGDNSQDAELTYCRAILEFSQDPDLQRQAQAILTRIERDPASLEKQKEAKFYLASFKQTSLPSDSG